MSENHAYYLDRRQAAKYLKDQYGPLAVAPATLAKMAVRGDGPAFVKLGKRVGYTRAALDAWVAAKALTKQSTSDDGAAPLATP